MDHRIFRHQIAMILAAGYGTRMKDLTRNLPKPLIPLNGFRLIDIHLLKLKREGFKRVIINIHYLREAMREYLTSHDWGVEICLSEEEELLGTGGGIAYAEQFFEQQTIMTLNADVLCNISLQDFIRFHNSHLPLATMAIYPSTNTRDYTLVVFDNENQLVGFLPRNATLPKGLKSGIFTGYQILTPEARSYLTPHPQSIITAFYQQALKEDLPIKVFPVQGNWIDVGTRELYESVRDKIRKGELDITDFM
ncbi:MAG: nucleotidyltransferase family protein [Calditrichaeota bacterium]|nr:MAG: nucleotidyltransferase family protein [Calditrichota bacterium]